MSDIHFRGHAREKDHARRSLVLGDEWERNLDELQGERPVDLVCFTGDVGDWGLAEDYEPATEFVRALLDRLRLPLDRFFVVPGNHDVNRSVHPDSWAALRDLASDPKWELEVSRWLAGGKRPKGIDRPLNDP